MRRFSPYNYCFDNPLKFVDPDGMGPYGAAGNDPTSSAYNNSANYEEGGGLTVITPNGALSGGGMKGPELNQNDAPPNGSNASSAPPDVWSSTTATSGGDTKKQTKAGKALQILGSLVAVDKNKTFMGKVLQVISHFTWELPQQTLGVFVAELTNVFGGISSVESKGGALILQNNAMRSVNGFSLGNILTVGVGADRATVSHEYGHYIQSRRFGGIGYLLGFAGPSAVRAFFWNMSNRPNETYNNFYTEKNAVKLGKKYYH